MAFPRPCIDCGKLTLNANRCDEHKLRFDKAADLVKRERKLRSGQYSGSYKRRAAEIRLTAVVCHLCNQGPRLDDPWQADHLIPGDPNSPLAAAHRSCNAARGNRPL